ncbi:hypothetical protein Emin_0670 [Elusimicrobium minutum Pei191]|uniref:Uncharacterized protein n=2 Tax=Elusimicrobium TaxID=423604 RepID=B2KC98_ELUMP|nr:hypothetical protein Emin_0670 [Elusimicrobium minutum Pei191]
MDIDFPNTGTGNLAGWDQSLGIAGGKFRLYLGPTQLLADRTAKGSARYTIVFYRADSSVWCGAEGTSEDMSPNDIKVCKALGGVLGTHPSSCSRNKCFKLR